MTSPLAFVTRLDHEEERQWLETLGACMPGERIVPFRDLSSDERRQAQIAIVANPDPAEVAALPGLAWIHSLWAGVERLVLELGETAPPIVRLVDPELARVMGEAALAWTYYLHRDMPAYRQSQTGRRWEPRGYRHPSEITVGLLGLGALGTEAARRLDEAGFRVQGWSRTRKEIGSLVTLSGSDGLDQLLATSDILVCLIPLTPETRGLLNVDRFTRMRKGASLINFARGPVVVTEDLLQALDRGQIDHAVLDVFDIEPLPETSPLWNHPRVTVLPHISAPTTPATAAGIVAGNIARWRTDGTLPPAVDLQRGY